MRRIPLVILYKQLGDVLLLEPALSKLADHSKGQVALATRSAFLPLISLMEHVVPAAKSPIRIASELVSFDSGVKAGITASTTLAKSKRLILMRAKQRRWWQSLAYPGGVDVLGGDDVYRARYFFDALPGDSNFRPPRLMPPPAAWRPANLPDDYVLLHPTSAWKSKSWPAKAWGNALKALHEQGIGPFVITGGSAAWEIEYVREVERQAAIPLINLAGKTSLNAYLAVVFNARLVLCVDGSSTHLAAAFGRPSVTLFGPSHPIHWHWPTQQSILIDARAYSEQRKPEVAAIPVEVVIDSAASLWKGTTIEIS